MKYLRGDKKAIIVELEKNMKLAAKEHRFEDAARFRNQLGSLNGLRKQIIFSDREFMDLSKDMGLAELSGLLDLAKPPKRIEGYDISHMSGTDTVASMVVFESGMPAKNEYRKFKMRIPGNDDFAHMHEVILRRNSAKNIKQWGLPDLFLIDGGKGQLGAAQKALKEQGIERPSIGLAKQYEQIVVAKETLTSEQQLSLVARAKKLKATIEESDDFLLIDLPDTSHAVKLLQRIRDESHRFAVSYHSVLKVKRLTTSWLDDVPTIGPKTKKQLIRTFGSTRGVLNARKDELHHLLGEKKATILIQYMRLHKKQDSDA
jgi:excinuclease ABC subunit C